MRGGERGLGENKTIGKTWGAIAALSDCLSFSAAPGQVSPSSKLIAFNFQMSKCSEFNGN